MSPLLLNPRLIEIQSMPEDEQLEQVHWLIGQLEYEQECGSHASEIWWVSDLGNYRDCTQYINVQIEAGIIVERYWKSYENGGLEDTE